MTLFLLGLSAGLLIADLISRIQDRRHYQYRMSFKAETRDDLISCLEEVLDQLDPQDEDDDELPVPVVLPVGRCCE